MPAALFMLFDHESMLGMRWMQGSRRTIISLAHLVCARSPPSDARSEEQEPPHAVDACGHAVGNRRTCPPVIRGSSGMSGRIALATLETDRGAHSGTPSRACPYVEEAQREQIPSSLAARKLSTISCTR